MKLYKDLAFYAHINERMLWYQIPFNRVSEKLVLSIGYRLLAQNLLEFPSGYLEKNEEGNLAAQVAIEGHILL